MFSQTATLTSKNQVTVPARIIKQANLKKGQKLVFYLEDGKIHIETALDQVKRLAGSLILPKKYQGIDLDVLIEQAKQEHFAN